MKPYCFDDKKYSAFMWVIIESLTKDLINLDKTDVKLTGLEFSALFLAPFLNIGETYAIFQYCGIHLSYMGLFRSVKDLDT